MVNGTSTSAPTKAGAGVVQGRFWRVLPPLVRYSLRVNLEAAAGTRAAAGSARAAGAAAALPLATAVCRADTVGDWSALWLGPDEQLLIGPEGTDLATQVATVFESLPYSLVDISHRQGAVEISGPYAEALLNTGCPLDLHAGAFPVGACTRTLFAKADIVLWRRGARQFHLEVWRSFRPYVLDLLTLIESEFLLQPESNV